MILFLVIQFFLMTFSFVNQNDELHHEKFEDNIFYLDTINNIFSFNANYGTFSVSSFGTINKSNNSDLYLKSDINIWLKSVKCVNKPIFFLKFSGKVNLQNTELTFNEENAIDTFPTKIIDSLNELYKKKYYLN